MEYSTYRPVSRDGAVDNATSQDDDDDESTSSSSGSTLVYVGAFERKATKQREAFGFACWRRRCCRTKLEEMVLFVSGKLLVAST